MLLFSLYFRQLPSQWCLARAVHHSVASLGAVTGSVPLCAGVRALSNISVRFHCQATLTFPPARTIFLSLSSARTIFLSLSSARTIFLSLSISQNNIPPTFPQPEQYSSHFP